MLNQKTKVKIKDKERGFERKKKRGNQQKWERIDEKNVVIAYFDVVLFVKHKQRRNKKKERDKNKEPKESKKERQEGRKT